MDDLEDELDLRYHRGLKPDVYYRCPTLESLDRALRNEIEKNASSLIPVEISITVDYALCRDINGKDRLKAQRAIARSIIEVVQEADGYKYSERSAQSKEGGDGTRFKYVCKDSFQNRDRKNNSKKEKDQDSDDSENVEKKRGPKSLLTYDCGGALHIKFSIKREAINVVYKQNPIHSSATAEESLPPLAIEISLAHVSETTVANASKGRKRKRTKKDHVDIENDYHDPDFDTPTAPESQKPVKKKRSKRAATSASSSTKKTTPKKTRKAKEVSSPTAMRKTTKPTSPPKPIRGKACLRCREKKVKCNEEKPACNQCRRGLWTCEYVIAVKKRSRNGCINCKARRRKCTEERPTCAYCIHLDDDCQYAEYS